ncbi:MAG: hypothetical protein KAI41_01020 [Hyphomicrobiaceae bacterium]|nr:hypothetical protein [Hyphomicrobiaceae bacterium]
MFVFMFGFWLGAVWANLDERAVMYECGGERLTGTLFTDRDALAVPGRLVLAWDEAGRKKLIHRDLFEICAEVPTN